ncbi:liver-expressed antimicrobial peptide 2 [Pantherophis guttatus]|uniref:Liver-expressed antimicrobial peptide 2 n=1 Tax=Pantherophis guttatus TaxID=94885 RepID=A0A6P9AQ24_PANGU|nr:liver-expressed antimicrobial peptide 2 [Pantherophis guttatus]
MIQGLKVLAIFSICSALLFQIHCASLHPENAQLLRPKRTTPFWRGLSRPVGAPCRDNSECFTRVCRNKLCSLRILQE